MTNPSEHDPVKLTLDLVGDTWTFELLRAAFYGARRFDAFQKATGASPNIVSARLKKLTNAGLFEKRRYSEHAKRFDYGLTEMGLSLYPIIVLMRQWGHKWLSDEVGEIEPLIHESCGEELHARLICGSCERDVDARAVSFNGMPVLAHQ